MIKLENTEVLGWEAAIRGLRNPMNSWEKSDSAIQHGDDYWGITGEMEFCREIVCKALVQGQTYDTCFLGPNDHDLMMRLAKAGSVDAKYRRMIVVTVDITAPLYWWKEFDTYKVGTVANSCSTMHKIQAKEFTLEDFSCEHLSPPSLQNLKNTIKCMNDYREWFLKDHDKHNWWQMIQLLPSSYNQRRTVMLNYEVLAGIYLKRKDHKLDEWHDFCAWIESLPYSEIITLEETEKSKQ